jgi:hypothetical protein
MLAKAMKVVKRDVNVALVRYMGGTKLNAGEAGDGGASVESEDEEVTVSPSPKKRKL